MSENTVVGEVWEFNLPETIWPAQMEALTHCLGESPEAIRGAMVVLRHLYTFCHYLDENTPSHEADGVPQPVVVGGIAYAAMDWLDRAAGVLIPICPTGAHCTAEDSH